MTFQTLTPTQDVPDGPGLDLTALLATPTNVNLQFVNSGRERLLIAAGAISETVTVDIGFAPLGQAVANFTTVNLVNGHVVQFGPFHSLLDQPGGTTVQIVLSTTTAITVALLQSVGVY